MLAHLWWILLSALDRELRCGWKESKKLDMAVLAEVAGLEPVGLAVAVVSDSEHRRQVIFA